MKPRIALLTPALADANNGNWHTARRWAAMLEQNYACDIAQSLDGLPAASPTYDALIALHARRSAPSMAAFAATCPNKPIILALTGTDVYRDIAVDAHAQRSLALAHTLIVLQDQALLAVPPSYRNKTAVVYQSCEPPLQAPLKTNAVTSAPFQVLVVGHLRAEKSPETVYAAVACLAHRPVNAQREIFITHLGAGLDSALATQAQHTQNLYPNHYRWVGASKHADTLQAIARSDMLLHPSLMEGGANVIIEAVQYGTPVLASQISGNVGMLGADYEGYFPVNDAVACAQAMQKASDDAAFLMRISQQCALRSPLFSTLTEQTSLRAIVEAALQSKAVNTQPSPTTP